MSAFVKLKAALPADTRNGLAEHAERIAGNGDAPVWALVRLDLDELRTRKKDGRQTAVLAIGHVEPVDGPEMLAELTEWVETRWAQRREVEGQQMLPTERDELLAQLAELSDDLGVSPAVLEQEYADRHGVPPAGDPDWATNLRLFLTERRGDAGLPARPVETVALPGEDGES